MNSTKNFQIDVNSMKQKAKKCLRRYRLAVPVVVIGMALILTTYAQSSVPTSFSLTPASDTIAACLPNASANVTVFSKEDLRGVDTLDMKAEGLPANTTFAVFLTELPNPPNGDVEYIGDFTTNASGRGSLRVDAIIQEAFSSAVGGGVRVRKELNHVVLWFADPVADDFCFAPGTGPITPFDGDGQAGAAALSSRIFLPGAPLP